MMHGVQGFFIERRRAARRVSLLAVGLGILLLAPLIALTLPPFQRPLREMLRRSTRFGYEGPDQYVRRISLQQLQGSNVVVHELGSIDTRQARPGGAVHGRRVADPHAQPETGPNIVGPGQANQDMTARAVSRLANVPVVQSEDLVIEHAAMPVYPQSENDRGIEGRVAVQALIDTTGRVIDVQLLASTGVRAFERSSAEAVWQYRFRPYRPGGVASEVYAIIRFWFRI
jgi:TonB family protein